VLYVTYPGITVWVLLSPLHEMNSFLLALSPWRIRESVSGDIVSYYILYVNPYSKLIPRNRAVFGLGFCFFVGVNNSRGGDIKEKSPGS
jgi:hypothetical protein